MNRVLLYVKDSPSARETAQELASFLKSLGKQVEIYINRRDSKEKPKKADLVVVVGGDGTFLSAARSMARYSIPIVGINEGRFGFLTEVGKQEYKEVLIGIFEGRLVPQRRKMLAAYMIRRDKRKLIGYCLNDAVVSKGTIARMVELDVYAEDDYMLRLYGDGLIVSTPTGSTAYALSAGGPIVYPLSEVILLVPICPHTLSNRPLVIPSHFSVRVVCLSPKRMAYLTLDGQRVLALQKYDVVEIKNAPYECLMYTSPHRGYFEILKEKLRWG
ncbi:NAD(+)/NADH kinase [Thermocrinis minervae]|uniref:NAD kinase n=1 Tax=Thermocrinis minervae TaxID=381751 RepID=A0A1M6SI38_9AQUI|nr:NAD(+)/NADH kinase [Thermocrinis minervae]SHK44287.1 NAD+ kinase [Thermocrinis minervae]